MESVRKLFISFKWIILALGLLTFTLLQHQKNKSEEELERKESLVFDFDTNDVQKISVKTLNKNIFVAEKKDYQWMILYPVKDFGAFFKIDDFLSRLLTQTAETVLSQNISWSEYDLSPPFSTFELQTKNQKKSIGISAEPNYDDRFYIKDKNTLRIGSAEWENISQDNFNDYVSKKIIHYFKKPTQIVYKTNKVNYTFKKNKGQWEWVGKKHFTLSQKAIEDWVSLFRKDIILFWVKNKKSQSEKKYSESDLFVEFFFEGDSNPWFLKLISVPESRDQVIISDRPYVYELKEKHGLKDVDFKESPPQKQSK